MITAITLNHYKVQWRDKIIIISYNYVVVLSLFFEERLTYVCQSYLREKHRENVRETVWIRSKANTFIGGLHNSAAIAGVRSLPLSLERGDASLIRPFHRIMMESAMRNVHLFV